jgi:coenzyme F420-reducing hydrogenase delta subunit
MALDCRSRPVVPSFDWPFSAQQIIIPCTGRLQPEHVLKAFCSGAAMVCVVACAEDNCHYLEGSKRCARRVEYIRSVLNEIGMGGERLMLFHLPGSAAEDMSISSGGPVAADASGILDARLSAIRDEVVRAVLLRPQSPLGEFTEAAVAGDFYQEETDAGEDDNDE